MCNGHQVEMWYETIDWTDTAENRKEKFKFFSQLRVEGPNFGKYFVGSEVDPCGREIVNCKSPICNLQFTASRTLWPDQFHFLSLLSLPVKIGFTHLVVRQIAISKSPVDIHHLSPLALPEALLDVGQIKDL